MKRVNDIGCVGSPSFLPLVGQVQIVREEAVAFKHGQDFDVSRGHAKDNPKGAQQHLGDVVPAELWQLPALQVVEAVDDQIRRAAQLRDVVRCQPHPEALGLHPKKIEQLRLQRPFWPRSLRQAACRPRGDIVISSQFGG